MAVTAKIVSAPMIIIVAITGLTGLMIQRIKGMVITLRFILLTVVSMAGLYGLMFAMLGFLIHLYNLNSFGVPIVSSIGSGEMQTNKDIFVRAPWWFMKRRPNGLASDPVRESGKEK